jgi:hypothetical protein
MLNDFKLRMVSRPTDERLGAEDAGAGNQGLVIKGFNPRGASPQAFSA